jgi:coproporphyrinogen III oxidase-like Fe-S oxidoreductase
MNAGVSLDRLRARFEPALRAEDAANDLWHDVTRRLERLEAEGLLRQTEGGVGLTDRGRLLADAVGSALLGLAEAGEVARLRERAVASRSGVEDVRA